MSIGWSGDPKLRGLAENELSDRDIAEWINREHDAEYNTMYNNACVAAYKFWHEAKNREWQSEYPYWSIGACDLYIIGQAKASIMGIRKAYGKDCIAAKIDENTIMMTVAGDSASGYGRFTVYIMAAGNMKMPSNCDYMFAGVQRLDTGLRMRKVQFIDVDFSDVISMRGMFANNNTRTPLEIGFNTDCVLGKVKDMLCIHIV